MERRGIVPKHNVGLFLCRYRQEDFFSTEAGRVKNQSGTLKYQYTLADHLGNTRVMFEETSGTPTVIEESHYYAFGMRIEGLSTSNPDNKFTYNGKELEDDHGLNWYHYGARFYDAQIGRWHSIDPLDEFPSPYVYVGNNPTKFIDSDGQGTGLKDNQTGQEISISEARIRVFKIITKYFENEDEYGMPSGKIPDAEMTINFKREYDMPWEIVDWARDFMTGNDGPLVTLGPAVDGVQGLGGRSETVSMITVNTLINYAPISNLSMEVIGTKVVNGKDQQVIQVNFLAKAKVTSEVHDNWEKAIILRGTAVQLKEYLQAAGGNFIVGETPESDKK